MKQVVDVRSKIARGNLIYLPVVPGRLEFALHVRRFLLANRPAVVAVELPSSLESQYRTALVRLPQMSVILLSSGTSYDEDEQPTYIPIEPADPFIEALRTAYEIGSAIIFLEPPSQEKPHINALYPPPYAAEVIGVDLYVESYRLHPPPRSPEMDEHAAAMAWKMQGADPLASTCVVVSLNIVDPLLDAMEVPQDEPAPLPLRLFQSAEVFNLHPDCLAEITSEIPFYQELYNQLRIDDLTLVQLERPRWQLDLLRKAESEYSVKTGDEIKSWQRIGLAKFARNLALLDHDLLPGAYDLAVAARSIVDDNYAYEVWEIANQYSVQQTEDPALETLNLSGHDVWLNTRLLRIRRRTPSLKQRLKPKGLASRKREQAKGEWAKQTDSASICSYPPEDLVIEGYGAFLKQHAKILL